MKERDPNFRARGNALALIAAVAVATTLIASAPQRASAQVLDLRNLLPSLLTEGITLAPPDNPLVTSHEAHFTASNSPQISAVIELNEQIGAWIATTPVSSSAGGFAYEFDPELGILSRTTESFGPIYAERPMTLGRGKFNVGVNHSRFTFDKFDELSLRDGDMQLVFTHQDADSDGTTTPSFEGDVITTRVSMRAESEITTLVASYGVGNRFDIGVAIPIAHVLLDVAAEATVQRLSTGGSSIHEFPNGSSEQPIRSTGEAEGVGDITLRAKYLFFENGDAYLGGAADVHLPTGDERDLLGAGTAQTALSFLAMMNRHPFSPHVNVGYEFAGGDIQDALTYVLGFDFVADPKLTIAADILGEVKESEEAEVRDQEFVYNTTINPNDPPVFETAAFPFTTLVDAGSRNIMSGSVGFKINFWQNMLLSANGLFPITEGGLRDDFSTLVGVDYSF
jgi:hypothetical protein